MSFVVEISIFSTSLMIKGLNLQQIFNPVVMAGSGSRRGYHVRRFQSSINNCFIMI